MLLEQACWLASEIQKRAPEWLVQQVWHIGVEPGDWRYAVDAWSEQRQDMVRFYNAGEWYAAIGARNPFANDLTR